MTQHSTHTILSAILVVSLALSQRMLDAAQLKPEKNRLEVAIAATGPLCLPLLLAADAGDFAKRGLQVNLTVLSATASAQALLSGTMGYLDGVKRALDDPASAKQIESHYSKITDAKLIEDSYQDGKKVWNKDMTVDPDAIKLVLEQSTVAKAAELDPRRFFDNTLIKEVNRDYASKLFPGQVK